MPKLIDYQCPECGTIKEGFEGEDFGCEECFFIFQMTGKQGMETQMRPIFSPKRNGQRWKHND